MPTRAVLTSFLSNGSALGHGFLCNAEGMNTERFAKQLLAYSGSHDGCHSLVVRAGPGHDVYFRFSEDRADPAHSLGWGARRNAVGSSDPSDGQAEWLARTHFQRDGDGFTDRVIAMPGTIGDARLIVALASFLLEYAYHLPGDTAVSVALEAA